MDSNKPAPVLRLERLERAYTQGNRRIDVLKGASASFFPGEAVALLGPVWRGQIDAAAYRRPARAARPRAVLINGVDCGGLTDKEQTRMRRMEVGFVYQFHHLLPEFSALENVVLPQLILGLTRSRGRGAREGAARHRSALPSAGTTGRRSFPAASSSASRSPARLPTSPKVLLADEPTGNLDPPTAERVFEQLLKLVRQSGVAAVVATHNLDLAARMDRTLAAHGRFAGRGERLR